MAKRFTIGQKLVISFATVIALTLVLAFSSIATITRLGNTLKTTLSRSAEEAALADAIGQGVSEMKSYAKMTQFAYAVNGMLDKKAAESCVACHTVPNRNEAQSGFDALVTTIHGHTAKLHTYLGSAGATHISAIDQSTDQWADAFRRFLDDASAGRFEGAHSIITDQMEPIRDRIEKASGELQKVQEQSLAQVTRDSSAQVTSARFMAIALVVVCLGAGIGVLWIIRVINASLRSLVARLADASRLVSEQAADIAAASEELAEGASRQSGSVDNIRQVGDSLTVSAQANAAETQHMAGFVSQIHESVDQATGTLGQGLTAMHRIDESSTHIARIIKVINEIAFQTNLLALNAAVEAARAGEAGLGFAVVAEEVRELAQRCAAAARETESLIGESIGRSREGKTQLETLAADIQAIVQRTKNLETAVHQLNLTSGRQTESARSIGQTLTEIDAVTRQSASSAQQTASSGERLSVSAADLDSEIHTLATLVGN